MVQLVFTPIQGNPRQSWILDSTQWIPDSRSLSVGLGFWIPIAIGIRDFLSCIPDSKAQDSGSKNFPNSGICISLHGVSFSRMVSGWFQEELSFMWRVFFCGCTTEFVCLFYFIFNSPMPKKKLTSFISFDFVLFMTKLKFTNRWVKKTLPLISTLMADSLSDALVLRLDCRVLAQYVSGVHAWSIAVFLNTNVWFNFPAKRLSTQLWRK